MKHGKKKGKKPRNYVAKYMDEFNRPATHGKSEKAKRKGEKQKFKNEWSMYEE